MARALLVFVLTVVAFAQNPTVSAFEVVSLKPQNGAAPEGLLGGCRRIDPGLFECNRATFRTMLAVAYGLRADQIKGPAWLNTEHYSLSARVRKGVAGPQFLNDLQALLTERFKMVTHRQTESLPAYELVVAKGGPRLKEVDPAQIAIAATPTPSPGASAPAEPVAGGAAVRGGPTPPVGTNFVRLGADSSRRNRGKMTISQLAYLLSGVLGKPVIDKTGLNGTYEIDLNYVADEFDFDQARVQAALASAAPESGGGSTPLPAANAGNPLPTLFQAVQQSLGLRLEAKKLPIEVLVVGQALKVPVEN